MEYDLTHLLQRKTFYFPRAYSRYYLGGPLARLLPLVLTPGGTFLDIGSSLGWFAMRAAEIVGSSGHVLAFEPDPQSVECVKRSAALNGFDQVRVFHLAIADCPGRLSFFRDPHGLRSSLVPSGYKEELAVEVSSIDELRRQGRLSCDAVQLVKIDVEGAEVSAVRGMLESLVAWELPPVWCEVRGPNGSSRSPDTLSPIRRELEALGYQALKYSGSGDVRPISEQDILRPGSQDVLFSTRGGGFV